MRGDALIVDGQRVVADASTRFTGRELRSLAAIPVGYEVKMHGRRRRDGVLLASRVEARPNGEERYEAEAKSGSDEVEQAWVSRGTPPQWPTARSGCSPVSWTP